MNAGPHVLVLRLSDSDYEINPYKRQVAGFDITNHWWAVRTSRGSLAR